MSNSHDARTTRLRGDRGEGVISAAIAVLIMAFLGALMWIHFTGWSPSPVTEEKAAPMSVRDNPGSSRSSYGGRSYTGAK